MFFATDHRGGHEERSRGESLGSRCIMEQIIAPISCSSFRRRLAKTFESKNLWKLKPVQF